jgi:F-type H+-transporting ATPase subunit gamma
MQTLQNLQRKIKSADDLRSVVRTMKTLAAVNIRQYEKAVRSLSDYYRTVEMGLRAVLLNRSFTERVGEPQETVALVFGSDQGMAGQFNESIIDFTDRALKEGKLPAEKVRFWVAGTKAAGSVEDSFGGFDHFFSLPSSAKATTATIQDMVLRLEKHRQEQGESRFVLFYNVPVSGASYNHHMFNLLPPDEQWLKGFGGRRWLRHGLPYYSLPWEEIFSALIGEYLFVSLFRAFAASMAAENAARLAAMQRAEKNIDEMKENLTAQYRSLRQSTITEELFDVISGFEALASSENEEE